MRQLAISATVHRVMKRRCQAAISIAKAAVSSLSVGLMVRIFPILTIEYVPETRVTIDHPFVTS